MQGRARMGRQWAHHPRGCAKVRRCRVHYQSGAAPGGFAATAARAETAEGCAVKRTHTAVNKPTPADVRAARDATGMTQTSAAKVIYSTLRTWQDWESGARRCHPGMLRLFRLLTGQEKLPPG